MKLILKIILLVSLIGSGCQSRADLSLIPDGTWIDLSHAYEESTPYWPTSEGFKLDTVSEGMTEGGYYYSAYSFSSAEHGGTHIDAPIHFAQGKQSVDEIPIDRLTGPAIVIDVTDSVTDYIDYQISIRDFEQWEKVNGQIPVDAIVLMKTGFSKYWPDRKQYMGTSLKGVAAVALLHFPGLDPEAATWLVKNRKIKAIGLDTPSIDYGRSSGFESHRILFEQNIPAFENLANLDKLPFTGAYIIALPMKIKGGSGGPLRIVAWVEETK